MNTRAKIRSFSVLLCCLGGWMGSLAAVSRSAQAADADALLEQMTSLNASALDDYSNGDFDKAKSRLLQAVALGKKDPSLQTHPLMARTFVHLGAVYVDGIEDRKTGVAYFVKALKLKPDIEVTEALVTKSVQTAFDAARVEAKVEVKPAAKEATAAATAPVPAQPVATKTAPVATKTTPVATKTTTAAPAVAAAAKADAKDKAASEASAATVAVTAKSEKSEKADKAEAKAVKEKEKQALAEREKLQKDLAADLAAAKGSEAKERTAKDKLIAEKSTTDKALADAKAQLLLLQKEKADREKQMAAEKDRLQKDLATAKDGEAKERTAKDKLIAEKATTDKALAETRAQLQQLEKDKADRDKQLAEAATREKRERDAKEKLLAEKQATETHQKELRSQEEAARLVRAKLAEGPEVPAHFAEPIHCNLPDEVDPNTDLFVHCIAKPGLGGKEMAIYYRAGNSTHYNSLELHPSKKGWQSAMIPASQVSGKALQYYVEVHDVRGNVAAANGKAASPNILSMHHAAPAARVARSTNSGGERKAAVLIQR